VVVMRARKRIKAALRNFLVEYRCKAARMVANSMGY
jgi:hypothetical protein